MVAVRPERSQSFEDHTDERLDAVASAVSRGDLVHKAKDLSFRYLKDFC